MRFSIDVLAVSRRSAISVFFRIGATDGQLLARLSGEAITGARFSSAGACVEGSVKTVSGCGPLLFEGGIFCLIVLLFDFLRGFMKYQSGGVWPQGDPTA